MKDTQILEAIEYFKQGLTSIDRWHRYTWNGLLWTHLLLREMAQVRRAIGPVRNPEFEGLRRSMGAWFKYFRWQHSKPSLVRGQIFFPDN